MLFLGCWSQAVCRMLSTVVCSLPYLQTLLNVRKFTVSLKEASIKVILFVVCAMQFRTTKISLQLFHLGPTDYMLLIVDQSRPLKLRYYLLVRLALADWTLQPLSKFREYRFLPSLNSYEPN
ncbi:hypothetical protein HHX47_DHR5000783 [Lentinula edodes]|nr:hypothetical protein HHX47_DHR5000783 [Lentinula edodes]